MDGRWLDESGYHPYRAPIKREAHCPPLKSRDVENMTLGRCAGNFCLRLGRAWEEAGPESWRTRRRELMAQLPAESSDYPEKTGCRSARRFREWDALGNVINSPVG